jgi:hypothetical protein
MKNNYKILIAFISVLLVSCNADDVENRPVIESVSTPELIAQKLLNSMLTEENGPKEVDRFVWSAASILTML